MKYAYTAHSCQRLLFDTKTLVSPVLLNLLTRPSLVSSPRVCWVLTLPGKPRKDVLTLVFCIGLMSAHSEKDVLPWFPRCPVKLAVNCSLTDETLP